MLEHYEEFDEQEEKIIEKFVTNTKGSIFALRNLPEVIKGALFSRYSRSTLNLRTLLLKEFILKEESSFKEILGPQGGEDGEKQFLAIKKAQNFYDRVLDGYGDDSIAELGGAHLAIENISMLAAKVIEDSRIGGSPLEKSTRYVYFDQQVGGEYLFYREPIIMTSAYRDLYLKTCNHLFNTYSQLIPPLTELMEKRFPKEHEVSKVAYTAALRAKVLDCLRGLLPASTLTNLGLHGNGRFFDSLIQKLSGHSLSELQEIAKVSHHELAKVIPSFIRRSESTHKYQKLFAEFKGKTEEELSILEKKHVSALRSADHATIRLLDYDVNSPIKVGAALLFPHSQNGLVELEEMCQNLPKEELAQILEAASAFRQSRRHKSPRALERIAFTFEIVADFGIYRDLQRHRILSQERQRFTCHLKYFIPEEILNSAMEKEYCQAMEDAKIAYDEIAKELPEEAQYVIPMAYNIRWYFHVSLRELQWLTELRSSPAGHPSYRYVAQEMAKQVIHVFPEFECFFKFVDYEGYELGRLGQETKIYEKRKAK